MNADGVDPAKIKSFENVNGIKSSDRGRSPLRQLNLLPLPPPQTLRRRTSVMMQKIHWRPVASDRLNNSLWASAVDNDSAINDSEVKELE
eukprot:CAMPEP_0194118226 /NCGR_PEP_ID=MMETSP0150-20130528/34560_1 /TAXON_ID=122233 /ORGANISM="Chaetoceros debilis, Strain MM31A-1" /LENGTH=89 /DNA_ID=CAMNT_0038809533 /DNA_START=45 /DNA_END=311 /DNA_ORIENTATION=-